jgi:hypothetical protein
MLRHPLVARLFWTDPTVVRHWIRGTVALYKTFVANRISEIQTLSEQDEWRHIPGTFNVADLATRAHEELHVLDLLSKHWLHGPEFLQDKGCYLYWINTPCLATKSRWQIQFGWRRRGSNPGPRKHELRLLATSYGGDAFCKISRA